jgi:hypothetical protein
MFSGYSYVIHSNNSLIFESQPITNNKTRGREIPLKVVKIFSSFMVLDV